MHCVFLKKYIYIYYMLCVCSSLYIPFIVIGVAAKQQQWQQQNSVKWEKINISKFMWNVLYEMGKTRRKNERKAIYVHNTRIWLMCTSFISNEEEWEQN